MAQICVEFFGMARQRAGVRCTTIEIETEPNSLRHVLETIVREFPSLGDHCICDGKLVAGYVANLDGDRFVSDPDTEIRGGSSLLIMSSDAGG